MHNSSLIQLLRCLDKKTLQRLHKYIASPFFNENQQALELFEYIIHFAPKYEDKELDRRSVFKIFFPSANYEKNNGLPIRRLMNHLQKLVDGFIEYKMLQENWGKEFKKINALDFYIEANVEKQFHKLAKQIHTKNQKQGEYTSMTYYEILYLTQLKEFDFFSAKDLKKSSVLLKKSITNFEYFSILSKLQYCCLWVCIALTEQTDEDFQMVKDLLGYIEVKNLGEVTAIDIYYHALHFLFDNSREEHFNTFKELFLVNTYLFNQSEARQLYVYAKNFCLYKIRAGIFEYNYVLFELFQEELKQGIIYANGQLLDSYFREIVAVGIRLNKLDWLEQFIEAHQNKILAINPKDVYLYNKARLAFHQMKYNKVLELIRLIDFKSIDYKLNARILILKVYYETGAFEPLESGINALKTFVYRDKTMSNLKKKRYKNFTNILSQIQNTIPKDEQRIDKLLKKVQDTKELVQRTWLSQKLEALRK